MNLAAFQIECALKHASERLVGLVLIATGARLRVHPIILKLYEKAAAAGAPAPPVSPDLLEPSTSVELVERISRHRELTPAAVGLTDWRAANGFDRLHELSNVGVPALVLSGTEDPLTPEKYAKHLAEKIPVSELVVFEGAGHMLPAERAAEAADAITRFVRKL